ncbi:MAG: NAD(P)/FAD-dependent oxidoreductase [Devosia sp.]|nr:NAD(P)/FAD-dependent oxidoreductase [Devosia sp.]
MSGYDAIVIGSGMGGLSAAAALARGGRRVLVLEQYQSIGGLSGSFARNGFKWDAGLHYLGDMGPGDPDRAVLDWLTDTPMEFASMGPVYDTLHFPDGFDLELSRPEAAQRLDLMERFPDRHSEIEAWFNAMHQGAQAMRSVLQVRALPEPFASAVALWNRGSIERWCGRTLAEVLAETTADPRLAAVLGAQWADDGGRPRTGSFGIHALTVGSYLLSGAYYPIGGAESFARHLVPTIKAAGGDVQVGRKVTRITIEDGKAVGVETGAGSAHMAEIIVSDIGAHETVAGLLPPELQQSEWARELLSLEPSPCHFSLFLGFEGDVEAAGATRSNHWVHASWQTDVLWTDLDTQPSPPGLFISFGSLKDPAHEPGPTRRHSGEVIAFADWSMVERWADLGPDARGPDYAAFKARVEQAMLDRFARQFPRLAPLIAYRELATPLATVSITGHRRGGFYGLENSPRRAATNALRMKTPIPGLYLCGQDVVTPGIFGAMWGGVLAAASVDPRVFQHIRG